MDILCCYFMSNTHLFRNKSPCVLLTYMYIFIITIFHINDIKDHLYIFELTIGITTYLLILMTCNVHKMSQILYV